MYGVRCTIHIYGTIQSANTNNKVREENIEKETLKKNESVYSGSISVLTKLEVVNLRK